MIRVDEWNPFGWCKTLFSLYPQCDNWRLQIWSLESRVLHSFLVSYVCSLFNHTVNIETAQCRMMIGWVIGKDLEGNELGLIEVPSPLLSGQTEQYYEKLQSGWPCPGRRLNQAAIEYERRALCLDQCVRPSCMLIVTGKNEFVAIPSVCWHNLSFPCKYVFFAHRPSVASSLAW
jgi:hypothetical protein